MMEINTKYAKTSWAHAMWCFEKKIIFLSVLFEWFVCHIPTHSHDRSEISTGQSQDILNRNITSSMNPNVDAIIITYFTAHSGI